MEQDPPPLSDPLDAILSDGTRYSMGLAVVIAIFAIVAGHWPVAFSVLLAAALFVWSLRQQMRAFQHMLARRISTANDPAPSASGHYGFAFLRILLLLLALGGILWYTPARPIGVVLGVGCVLVGLAVAALNPKNR